MKFVVVDVVPLVGIVFFFILFHHDCNYNINTLFQQFGVNCETIDTNYGSSRQLNLQRIQQRQRQQQQQQQHHRQEQKQQQHQHGKQQQQQQKQQQQQHQKQQCEVSSTIRFHQLAFTEFFSKRTISRLPKSSKERDDQAISSIKSAIASPRTPSFPLIECEFPPLSALNKLGDGSLRSSMEVDDANLEFCSKLVRSLLPPLPPFLSGSNGPKVWLVTSSTTTNRFYQSVETKLKGTSVLLHSLKNGIPNVKSRDVCIFVTPSVNTDYTSAKRLAMNGNPVVLVNGFAKDTRSVPGDATMAFYLKPLTYNSQTAGYLLRSYPGLWTTLDYTGQRIIGSFEDNDILVPNTNTPDLRQSVKLVQKATDENAIRSRQN